MIKLKLIFFLFFFLIAAKQTFSYEIELPNQVIERGALAQLPIRLTGIEPGAESIELNLRYNAFVIEVRNVIGGDNFLMGEQSPDVTTVFLPIEQTSIKIESRDVNSNNDVICNIIVEGLAAPDSTTTLELISLIVDGEEKETTSSGGNITVRGDLIKPGILEGLRDNYPNPFNYNTTFPFSLREASTIEIEVYGFGGRRVLSIGDNPNTLDYLITSDEDGTSYNSINGVEFPEGSYELSFRPINNEFASGKYFLVLKTKNGVYKTNFIYLK